jgi:hypothetical protein
MPIAANRRIGPTSDPNVDDRAGCQLLSSPSAWWPPWARCAWDTWRVGRIRISPWVWPVVALMVIAGAGRLWGPTGVLLTAGGLVILLAGVAIGVRWVDKRMEKAVRVEQQSSQQKCTDLRGARLTGAKLANADLRSADLRGADLTNADLSGANLENAVLSPLDGDDG